MIPSSCVHPRRSQQIRTLLLSGGMLLSGLLAVGRAQVTLDGSLGPQGPLPGPNYHIGAELGQIRGSNLFQSFGQFNVQTGESATFTGPNTIVNIVSRVTGGQQSLIDGLLRSEILGANLYLLNPSGVLFGSNASLDVRGSFHVSTADFLRFADGAKFSANLGQESVLTVAAPAAFGFLGANPAPITIRGSSLQVPAGQAVSVVGGDIDIIGNGGPITDATVPTLLAPSGRIQLASVASPGEVGFSPLALAPDLQVDSFARLGRLELSQGALVTVGRAESRNAGTIVGWSREFTLSSGSRLSATTSSSGEGGRILVIAPAVQLMGDVRMEAGTEIGSPGNGGTIEVRADTLTLTGGGRISTTAQGSGRAGTVTVTATEAITIAGARPNGSPSGLGAGGSGGAGRIVVSAPTVSLAEGNIAATGGNGGTIEVRAGTLTLTEGGQIDNSINSGPGQAGTVTVTATEAITIAGRGPGGLRSGFSSDTRRGGNGGRIVITAPLLSLRNAEIEAQVLEAGRGNGGDIEVHVGTLTLTEGARLLSDTDTSTSGNGGRIVIMATHIELRDGGSILASSRGVGAAGNIRIQARETFRSQRGSVATAANRAGGGAIVLTAGRLVQLRDSALTTSVRGGGGDAGNLTLDSPLVIAEGSQIVANAFAGMGGRIHINSNVFVADPASEVSASSDLGLPGTVDITGAVTGLTWSVAPLPQTFVHVAALLPVRCAARAPGGRYSSLVVGGRDGPPDEPGGVLASPLALEERLIADTAIIGAPPRPSSTPQWALLAGHEKRLPRLGCPQG
jgi:filamentous hemagglutinin family protein